MADTLDHLTLAEGYAALRQGSSTANQTVIERLITAASVRVDRGVGPVVVRTITAETYDGDDDEMIQLLSWPVSSVTTVVENGVTLSTTDWHIDKEKGQLWRRLGNEDYCWGEATVGYERDNIAVTYVAGRFADTASVDAFYKEGTVLLLRHLWRSEQWNVNGIGVQDYDVPQVAFPSFSVPKAVIDWFGGAWRDRTRGGFA